MNVGKLLVVGTAIVVFAAVTASIWLNPPAENRARSLDHERLARLQRLKGEINAYFVVEKVLPDSLDTLIRENRLGDQAWRDPETGRPFEYQVTGEKAFSLCTNFARGSDEWSERYYQKHKAGRDCFEHKATGKL